MTVAIVGGVLALIVVFVLLSRMQSNRKNEAMADLQQEIDNSHTPDILDLVNEEVDDAGIRNLPGADEIDPTVLLKVWKRDGADCAAGRGEFVVSDGIAPAEATEDDVTFECGGDEAGTE